MHPKIIDANDKWRLYRWDTLYDGDYIPDHYGAVTPGAALKDYNQLSFHLDTFKIMGTLSYVQILNGKILVIVKIKQYKELFEYEDGVKVDKSKWVNLGPELNLGEYEPEELNESEIYSHVETLVSKVIDVLI